MTIEFKKFFDSLGNYDLKGYDLTTLEGYCPDKVIRNFYCCGNKIKSLKGCPKICNGFFDCRYNELLEDISDMPSTAIRIYLRGCPNVKVFTKDITTKNGLLEIWTGTFDNSEHIHQLIKDWPYYDIVDEDDLCVTVKIKQDNELFMDLL